MAIPWQVLDRFETADEGFLELRKRGKGDFLITIGPQVLMNCKAQRSQIALGKLGCKKLKNHPNPRVLGWRSPCARCLMNCRRRPKWWWLS